MKIDDHAGALAGDGGQRLIERLAALATERPKDIPIDAVRVHAHQRCGQQVWIAVNQGEVAFWIDRTGVADGAKLAVSRDDPAHGLAFYESFMTHPVTNEVGDRDELELVLETEGGEIGEAGHGAVVVHDFANHATGGQAGEAGEVDGRLGLSGADENAALAGAEGKDMTGPGEILGAGAGLHAELDREGTVCGRDTRGDAVTSIDGFSEGGAKIRRILGRHEGQAKSVAAFSVHR